MFFEAAELTQARAPSKGMLQLASTTMAAEAVLACIKQRSGKVDEGDGDGDVA